MSTTPIPQARMTDKKQGVEEDHDGRGWCYMHAHVWTPSSPTKNSKHHDFFSFLLKIIEKFETATLISQYSEKCVQTSLGYISAQGFPTAHQARNAQQNCGADSSKPQPDDIFTATDLLKPQVQAQKCTEEQKQLKTSCCSYK